MFLYYLNVYILCIYYLFILIYVYVHIVESDSDSDSDSDSSQHGIALDKIISNERTEVIFEFNDMQELYAEGMTILCKKLIINPTPAYELSLALSKQGNIYYYLYIDTLYHYYITTQLLLLYKSCTFVMNYCNNHICLYIYIRLYTYMYIL